MTRPGASIAFALSVLAAPPAAAFDAATTHAGLTEGAALASRLGKLLAGSHGRPLGLWEPLRLPLEGEAGRRLGERLGRLDPAGGYAPAFGDGAARLPAFEWLVAGAVLEEVPVERGRHHFFDPQSGRGLAQGGFLGGFGLRVAGVREGSASLRGLFTGASFDGTGMASTAWLSSARNDLGLARFLDARERATAAATPAEREGALAEALLAAGAMLHVVQDAADPAHVRNDYRVAFAERGARLRRYVAERWGRLGVPAPVGPPRRLAHLAEAIHDGAGEGLADRIQRRFFSDGSLPGSGAPYRQPEAVAGPGARGYVSGEGVRHLASWTRDARGQVTWAIDDRCVADYAEVVVTEAAEASLSALDHLLRGDIALEAGAVVNGPLALGPGKLHLLAEDDAGRRRAVVSREIAAAAAGERILELPAGGLGRRVAAVFRGVDAAGEPIVVAIESR